MARSPTIRRKGSINHLVSKVKCLTSHQKRTERASYRKRYVAVQDFAKQYLDTNPLPNTMANQRAIYAGCQRILSGDSMHPTYLRHLAFALVYRLRLVRTATDYKNLLGLAFPDCDGWDYYGWNDKLMASMNPRGPITSLREFRVHEQICEMIWKAQIFDAPTEAEGYPDLKPVYYLTAACIESGRSIEQVNGMLKFLAAYKAANAQNGRSMEQ
ncbi:MAG: hypothetical protein Q9166_005531 [cf. Caloplaca sp. 2 TL-2023]